MKNFLYIILIGSLAFSFTACSDDDDDNPGELSKSEKAALLHGGSSKTWQVQVFTQDGEDVLGTEPETIVMRNNQTSEYFVGSESLGSYGWNFDADSDSLFITLEAAPEEGYILELRGILRSVSSTEFEFDHYIIEECCDDPEPFRADGYLRATSP